METMLEEETLFRLALTRTKGIGPAPTKKLIEHFGNAVTVFRAKEKALLAAGVKKASAAAIVGFRGEQVLQDELRLLEKKGIRLLFFTDPEYPRRLLGIAAAPPLLFYCGNADLNAEKIVAVIGTRLASDYGRQV